LLLRTGSTTNDPNHHSSVSVTLQPATSLRVLPCLAYHCYTSAPAFGQQLLPSWRHLRILGRLSHDEYLEVPAIIMAATARQLRITPSATFLMPRSSAPIVLSSWRWGQIYAREYSHQLLPSLSIAIPGLQIRLPQIFEDIWESVLKAVPKKKTSHAKKRHRQMAGKALKDVHSLCTCPGCGHTKRMHRLCPQCMGSKF
jgi:ribosomal protein L32